MDRRATTLTQIERAVDAEVRAIIDGKAPIKGAELRVIIRVMAEREAERLLNGPERKTSPHNLQSPHGRYRPLQGGRLK